MSTSLDYSTADPVTPQAKQALNTEAQQLAQARVWWAESLNFFDAEGDGRLCGGTKIFLIGYETGDGEYVEVDPDEDSLMAYQESCFILDRLAEWSRKHNLAWNIDCAGEPIGTISNGQWDAKLQDYMAAMKNSFPCPASLDNQTKVISAKYASRW